MASSLAAPSSDSDPLAGGGVTTAPLGGGEATLPNLRDIPFTDVRTSVRRMLAVPLQPPGLSNWHRLGEEFGIPETELAAMETKNLPNLEGLHGLHVFDYYSKMVDNSLGELWEALVKIERHDVLKILEEELPSIVQRFEERKSGRGRNKRQGHGQGQGHAMASFGSESQESGSLSSHHSSKLHLRRFEKMKLGSSTDSHQSSTTANFDSLGSTGSSHIHSGSSASENLSNLYLTSEEALNFEVGHTRGENGLASLASIQIAPGDRLLIFTAQKSGSGVDVEKVPVSNIGATLEVNTSGEHDSGDGDVAVLSNGLVHDRSPPSDRHKQKQARLETSMKHPGLMRCHSNCSSCSSHYVVGGGGGEVVRNAMVGKPGACGGQYCRNATVLPPVHADSCGHLVQEQATTCSCPQCRCPQLQGQYMQCQCMQCHHMMMQGQCPVHAVTTTACSAMGVTPPKTAYTETEHRPKERLPQTENSKQKQTPHRNIEVHQQRSTQTAKTNQSLATVASPDKAVKTLESGAKPPEKANTSRSVYVTYWSNYKKTANVLRESLKQHGFIIALDNHEKPTVVKDIKRRFRAVRYVLVCLSPAYSEHVWGNATSANLSQATSPCHLVYRLMMQEYQKNEGINRRFVPLLCEGATWDHVPKFLQRSNPKGVPQIRTYIYPQDQEDLYYFLNDPEKVVSSFIQKEKEKEEKKTVTKGTGGREGPVVLYNREHGAGVHMKMEPGVIVRPVKQEESYKTSSC